MIDVCASRITVKRFDLDTRYKQASSQIVSMLGRMLSVCFLLLRESPVLLLVVADVLFSATATTVCAKRTGAATSVERRQRESDRAILPA